MAVIFQEYKIEVSEARGTAQKIVRKRTFGTLVTKNIVRDSCEKESLSDS